MREYRKLIVLAIAVLAILLGYFAGRGWFGDTGPGDPCWDPNIAAVRPNCQER